MKKITITLSVLLFTLNFAQAQFSIVTNNLKNPAGLEADDNGNNWVTETGTGANDGRVLFVRGNSIQIPVVVDLPSFKDPVTNETSGAWRTIQLPNKRMAVIIGEGPTSSFGRILFFNMTGFVIGNTRPKTMADTVSSIEISSFALAQAGVTNSNPFSAASDTDGNWFVVDAGANMIVKVTPQGQKSVFAKFPRFANPTPIGPPFVDPVPTKIIARPEGGFYVCNLTGFPFVQGQAAIYTVDKNGVVTPFIRGLSLLTDLALDQRTGDLYAMQFGSYGFAPSPGFVFGSGKVLRIKRGSTNVEVVASNFGPGAGLSLDRRGNMYVSSLFTAQLLKMSSATRCFDLDLELTADNNTLSLYSSIKYTLKVTNRGTTAANNVKIFWLPPYKRSNSDDKPFAFQGAYSSKGWYDSWNGNWTIDNLAAGETATANFHLFVVNDKLDATQTAVIASCNESNSSFSADASTENYDVKLVTHRNTEGGQPFSVYPNPVSEKLTVSIDNPTDSEWQIKLINVVGQTVFTRKGGNNQTLDVNVRDWQNGLYIMEYQSENERKTEKIVIRH